MIVPMCVVSPRRVRVVTPVARSAGVFGFVCERIGRFERFGVNPHVELVKARKAEVRHRPGRLLGEMTGAWLRPAGRSSAPQLLKDYLRGVQNRTVSIWRKN